MKMNAITCVLLSVEGFGVGGEYPTSASTAAEKAQSMSGKGANRGAIVGMTFSCQGAGAVFGSVVIMILLLITGEGSHECTESGVNADGHDESDLSLVWRLTYGIGYVIIHCKCSQLRH